MKQVLISLFPVVLALLFPGCKESGTDFQTDCGVVQEDKVMNPISSEAGMHVTILEVADCNLVIGRDKEGYIRYFILHGLSNELKEKKKVKALRLLRSFGEEALFYRAESDCNVKIDRDIEGKVEAIPGQLFTLDGLSYSEELLRAGYAALEKGGQCNSDLIRDCQSALLEVGP